jgi:preprotein translocase subunit Sec63
MPESDKNGFDPLSMNMNSIFKQFKGANINRVFITAMQQKLRQMHKQLGDMINDMNPTTYGTIDPWVVLGVDKNATHDEVHRAYKKKSKEVHPDKGGTDEQQIIVNVAYEVICKVKGWVK